MKKLVLTALVAALLMNGCAGCGPLDDVNVRNESGGTPPSWDAGEADFGGSFEQSDAGGRFDQALDDMTSEDPDMDNVSIDLGTSDTGGVDMGPADLGPVGPVCGDGIVELPEQCDDGVTMDCVGTHDGGDGSCMPIGTCAAGFIFDGATCVPEMVTQHVHIYVENDCSMMVDPPELNVPRGQTVRFSWHNHSQFYAVDVWQSYIGGFTDLAPRMTWNEQFEWCFNVNPYVGYSDISSAPGCPEHRFYITCNGR